MAKHVHTKLAAAVEARQKVVAASLRAVFAEWARSIAKKLSRKFGEKVKKVDPAIEELVAEILASLDLDSFGQDVVDEISAELESMYQRASQAGLAQVKMEPTDEIVNHLDAQARDYVAQRGAELVGKKVLSDGSLVDNPDAKWSIAKTTREDLRAVLTDGVEQGWSAQRLSDVIESSGAFDEARADMIARTELAYAHVAGNVEGWRQSGEVTGKRSMLGDLHDVPDECDDNADEGVIDFEDAFSSGDDFPPYHPNCVCDVEPVLSTEGE
jgi:hypothetical protein